MMNGMESADIHSVCKKYPFQLNFFKFKFLLKIQLKVGTFFFGHPNIFLNYK